MTVTENIVTSIQRSDEDFFGIMVYAMVLKTCKDRKEMKPVATRGITSSMGMKKPAKGMKSNAVNGQKKRRIRMETRLYEVLKSPPPKKLKKKHSSFTREM